MQAQAQQMAQQRQMAAIPGLFNGGQSADGAGGFDVQKAIQLGMSPKQIVEYAGLTNLGRQKVARTIETTGPDGRPVTIQLDEFGKPVGDGMAQWKAPIMVNQGDRTTAIDQTTLQSKGSFGVNMSPSERDASARGWASNSIAMQRLEHDKTKPPEAEKPVWDAVTRSWVYRPSADAPTGRAVPISGYTKPLNNCAFA